MFGFTEVMVQSMAKDIRDEGIEEGQALLATLLQKLMSAGRWPHR